jgi:hypothetical protein
MVRDPIIFKQGAKDQNTKLTIFIELLWKRI